MGKFGRKFNLWKRKQRIIDEGDCSIKHVFSGAELMKASLKFNPSKKLKCQRCKKKISFADILSFVADRENIDLTDKKSLFKKYDQISEEQLKEEDDDK